MSCLMCLLQTCLCPRWASWCVQICQDSQMKLHREKQLDAFSPIQSLRPCQWMLCDVVRKAIGGRRATISPSIPGFRVSCANEFGMKDISVWARFLTPPMEATAWVPPAGDQAACFMNESDHHTENAEARPSWPINWIGGMLDPLSI